MTARSGAPLAAESVALVCRRSWKRTPSTLAARHDEPPAVGLPDRSSQVFRRTADLGADLVGRRCAQLGQDVADPRTEEVQTLLLGLVADGPDVRGRRATHPVENLPDPFRAQPVLAGDLVQGGP